MTFECRCCDIALNFNSPLTDYANQQMKRIEFELLEHIENDRFSIGLSRCMSCENVFRYKIDSCGAPMYCKLCSNNLTKHKMTKHDYI